MRTAFFDARGSLAGAGVVIALLSVSLLVALPMQSVAAQTSQTTNSVVPTVLSGFRSMGPLAGSTPVFVTVAIPLQNTQELDYLTQQISTPGSPMYRHFLTQSEVQAFLPVSAYESALSYLEGLGLKVVSSSLDSIIVAEGTASQVSQSLGLEYELYGNGSAVYYTSSGSSPISGAYVYSSNVTAVFLDHPPDLVSSQDTAALDSADSSQTNQTEPLSSIPLTDLQSVYNATSLYKTGDNGAGYTVGILDFYGDPYISQQLQYFDSVFGLPASPFTITPIGPYNPSLGVYEGWDAEISLDVESVHSMAPQASIDLYIANGALPLASAIAAIDQNDNVNDVTQSFGYPESVLSEFGATGLEVNVILADQYYMLGSDEGITFIGSTADNGGSGFSGGPEGTPSYPATSPYVVAVGGTTTYLTYNGNDVASYEQTAWSSYGFVPYEQNYGGSTGGVSILEPLPWYQSSLSVPSTFASGRLTPDISLNAALSPGVDVILPGNSTGVYGGTSESNQLFGGLLTLLMSASKSSLGLLNPTLYAMGNSSSTYSKVYDPITFGYTIPWTASSGYNLATGLGAPNVGEMARYISSATSTSLGVNVTAIVGGSAPTDLMPGQVVTVAALVTQGKTSVTTGKFTAQLETLSGNIASAPLSYSASNHVWTGEITVPDDAAGMTYVTVSGTSGSDSGTGFFETFSGYVASYLSPTLEDPYSAAFGIPLDVNITTLDGTPVTAGSFTFSASTYSIQSNTYTQVGSVTVAYGSTSFGNMWHGSMSGNYPDDPLLISGEGSVYGLVPIINGVMLQESFVETTVLAQPGVVAPGQSVFIIATLVAPLNTPAVTSAETDLPVTDNVEVGSNVTASLVSQSGKVETTTTLYLNSYLTSEQGIQGELTVPSGLQPGLYDVILNSSYDSIDLGTWINGSYFAQVYVAPAVSTVQTTITPSTAYQGQTVTVNAKIDYANGSAVKYGVYSATVYPTDLQDAYNYFSEYVTVPLFYQASTGLWTTTVTLPSAYNAGGTVQVDQGALYLSGPYDVFVTGISADGVPSNTSISVQQQLQIEPYLYVSGQTVSSLPQYSQVALSGDTIGPALETTQPAISPAMTGDLFLGSDTIQGESLTISQSQIQGTLTLENCDVTLVGVTGGTVVAQDSTVVLEQSSLSSLQLTNSHVSMNASVVDQISPSLPTVTIQSPGPNSIYNGTSARFTVAGDEISSVSVYLDGVLLQTLSPASSYNVSLTASSMTVGVHTLEVVAIQQDGLSSSSSVAFSTDAPLVAQNNSISTLDTAVSSQSGRISSLDSQLNTADDLIYVLAVLAVVALLVAIVAVARKPKSSAQPRTSPPDGPAPAPEPFSPPPQQNAPPPEPAPGQAPSPLPEPESL